MKRQFLCGLIALTLTAVIGLCAVHESSAQSQTATVCMGAAFRLHIHFPAAQPNGQVYAFNSEDNHVAAFMIGINLPFEFVSDMVKTSSVNANGLMVQTVKCPGGAASDVDVTVPVYCTRTTGVKFRANNPGTSFWWEPICQEYVQAPGGGSGSWAWRSACDKCDAIARGPAPFKNPNAVDFSAGTANLGGNPPNLEKAFDLTHHCH